MCYLKTHQLPQSEIFLNRLGEFLNKKWLKNYKKVLDIGTGYGVPALGLKKFDKKIIGIDSDPKSLIFCKKYGIEVKLLDVEKEKFPFSDNSFDAVTCFNLIEHIKTPKNLLQEVYRVLRTKGIFILVTPNYKYWKNRFYEADNTHKTPYTPETLKESLHSYKFKILYFKERFFLPFFWRLSSKFFEFTLYYPIFFVEQSGNMFLVAEK